MGWKENVIAAHALNKYPHWKIVRGTNSKANAMCSSEGSDADFTASHQRLKECIELVSMPGAHLIQFRDSLDKSANFLDYTFEVPTGASMQTASPGIGSLAMMGYVSKADMQEAIEKERRVWELERKHSDAIAELTKTVKELKEARENEGPLSFLNNPTYAPIIAGVLSKMGLLDAAGAQITGPQVGIAGTNAPAVPATFTRQQNNASTSSATTTETMHETEITPEQQAINETRMGEVMQYLVNLKGGPTEAITFLFRLKKTLEANPHYLPMVEGMLVKID